MGAFAAALGTLLSDPNLGVDIVYTPTAGSPVSCRGAFSAPDVDVSAVAVKTRAHARMLDVRATDIAAPKNGEQIAICAAQYKIIDVAQRDALRLMFTLSLAPL